MSTKMTKRELQSPDKFMTTTRAAFDWAVAHPRESLIGGVVLVVVLVAVGLIAGSDLKVDPKAGVALSEALALSEKTVKAPDAEAAKPAGDDAAKPTEGEAVVDNDTFPSETAKQEAIAAALEKVRADFPGTSSAVTAALSLGDANFKLGKYDEALALYDEYLAKAPKKSSLRFLALEGRASALQSKKDYEGALAAWDKLSKEAPGYEARALLGKAILFEGQKDWDKARASYDELKSSYPESPSARTGSERLTALNFQHPPVEKPADAEKAPEAPAAEADAAK